MPRSRFPLAGSDVGAAHADQRDKRRDTQLGAFLQDPLKALGAHERGVERDLGAWFAAGQLFALDRAGHAPALNLLERDDILPAGVVEHHHALAGSQAQHGADLVR